MYIVVENYSTDKDDPKFKVLGTYKTIKAARKAIHDECLPLVVDDDELYLGEHHEWGSTYHIAKIKESVRPVPVVTAKIILDII